MSNARPISSILTTNRHKCRFPPLKRQNGSSLKSPARGLINYFPWPETPPPPSILFLTPREKAVHNWLLRVSVERVYCKNERVFVFFEWLTAEYMLCYLYMLCYVYLLMLILYSFLYWILYCLFAVSFLFFCTLFLIQFCTYIYLFIFCFFVQFLCIYPILYIFYTKSPFKSVASLELVFWMILYLFFIQC